MGTKPLVRNVTGKIVMNVRLLNASGVRISNPSIAMHHEIA